MCQVADITRGETLGELARSVLAQAAPRFSLVGFSLGGYVAQEIARLAPERVMRLALLDTSIHADTPERTAIRRALDKAARLPGKFHGFGDRLLKTYLDPSHLTDSDIVARIRAMTERLGPETFVRQNNIERKDGVDVLRSLACPILILCGENDALIPNRKNCAGRPKGLDLDFGEDRQPECTGFCLEHEVSAGREAGPWAPLTRC
jgi:pimeloyl-ACP methyl ester carboxylesterase